MLAGLVNHVIYPGESAYQRGVDLANDIAQVSPMLSSG